MDGIDISPVLFEQGSLPDRPLFWSYLSNGGARSEAMRQGPWKLVLQHPGAPEGTYLNQVAELYNLEKDLGETTNLLSRQPKQAARMLQQLYAWLKETEATQTPQEGDWVESGLTGAEANAAFKKFRDETQASYSTKP
jgi:arylsulfatase A